MYMLCQLFIDIQYIVLLYISSFRLNQNIDKFFQHDRELFFINPQV